MVIVLDTYDNPFYTTRVWCIYETYIATATQILIDVAMPGASKDANLPAAANQWADTNMSLIKRSTKSCSQNIMQIGEFWKSYGLTMCPPRVWLMQGWESVFLDSA